MSAGVEYNGSQRMAAGVTSMLMLLSTVVVYLRLYIRCIYLGGGSAGWDDVTVFISWVMAAGASGASYVEIYAGLGRHMADLSPQEVYKLELSWLIVIHFYNVGLNTVKISFLSQYYRIFPDRIIRRICFCYGVFCCLWMFGQAILYSLSCVPIVGLVPNLADICLPTLPVWTAISSINVFTDIVIFSIPLKPLWSMPMHRRQRYLLTGIFCIGFLVCVISIIRIPTLRQGAQSPDPSYTNVSTAIWSLAELQTAILCTSLPILRPLAARFMRGINPLDEHQQPLARPHDDDPERVVERPKHHKNPWADTDLLKITGLTGSTLKSTLRSLTHSTPRTEVHTDGEEQEDASSPPSTAPRPVVKLEARAPTIPNVVTLEARAMAVLDMEAETVRSTPRALRTAVGRLSPSSPESLSQKTLKPATPALATGALSKVPYATSSSQTPVRIHPHDLRDFHSFPNLLAPQRSQLESSSSGPKPTTQPRQYPTTQSAGTQTGTSLKSASTPSLTANPSPAASIHSTRDKGVQVAPADTLEFEIVRYIHGEKGQGQVVAALKDYPKLLARPAVGESSDGREFFGFTRIHIPNSSVMSPPLTSWLRLTPDWGDEP